MPKTVYIETTIPSQYFSRRTDAKSVAMRDWTREWWERERSKFDLVTSVVTINELGLGNHPDKAEKLALIESLRELSESPRISEIVQHYIGNRLMPADVLGDAAHLAYASLHACDYLLTWNIRHIANHNKEKHLVELNSRLGLSSPILLTPYEFLEEGGDL